MILPLLLSVAIVAAPPSPRAVREHHQTIDRRHNRHQRARAAHADWFGPVWEAYPVYWYSPWPIYYPPTAGQLPPGWNAAYGGFLGRMEEASQ